MEIAQFITGIFFILFGIGLFIFSFYGSWVLIIYAIFLIIIGLIIFLNKNEDKIEERKDLNKNEVGN